MLSAKSLKKIDFNIAKYPSNQKQSAVMAALTIAQVELGWISLDVIQFIAKYLDMPAIAVQEVATFYKMYNLTPVGQYKISICTSLPCQLSGAKLAVKHLKCKLKINFNDTTKDNYFTLKESECMGACGDAPVLLINNHFMYSFMSINKIDQMLEELKNDMSSHQTY